MPRTYQTLDKVVVLSFLNKWLLARGSGRILLARRLQNKCTETQSNPANAIHRFFAMFTSTVLYYLWLRERDSSAARTQYVEHIAYSRISYGSTGP